MADVKKKAQKQRETLEMKSKLRNFQELQILLLKEVKERIKYAKGFQAMAGNLQFGKGEFLVSWRIVGESRCLGGHGE